MRSDGSNSRTVEPTWTGKKLGFYDGNCSRAHGFYIERRVTGSIYDGSTCNGAGLYVGNERIRVLLMVDLAGLIGYMWAVFGEPEIWGFVDSSTHTAAEFYVKSQATEVLLMGGFVSLLGSWWRIEEQCFCDTKVCMAARFYVKDYSSY